jgi:hypothetical protein
MSLSLLPLLIHEEDVPASARAALREATAAPLEQRPALLEVAARSLYRDAHLDCDDARELVGLL